MDAASVVLQMLPEHEADIPDVLLPLSDDGDPAGDQRKFIAPMGFVDPTTMGPKLTRAIMSHVQNDQIVSNEQLQ